MPKPIIVHFIGTGAAAPFNDKLFPCIALRYDNYLILFDVGEGCQFGLFRKKIHPVKSHLIVLISHFHADHTVGLVGLLHTLKISGKGDVITIIGPNGLREFIQNIKEVFLLSKTPYKLALIEIDTSNIRMGETIIIYEEMNFVVKAFKTIHDVPSIGYIFEERRIVKFNAKKAEMLGIPRTSIRRKLLEGKEIKLSDGRIIRPEDVIEIMPGRKIVYTGDTRPLYECIPILKNADLLIHDATFLRKHDIERAEKRYHSTIEEAIEIAKKANARILALVHISPRYRREEIREAVQKMLDKIIEKGEVPPKIILPEDGESLVI